MTQIPVPRGFIAVGYVDDLDHMFHGFDNITPEQVCTSPVGLVLTGA